MENLTNNSSCQNLFGLAIDPNVLFTNHKNIYKAGIEKRQTKLLKKVPFLERFLKEDEKIIHITTGCSPMSILEQWLMGLWIFYIKRCLLVFTNKRVLHIPTNINYSYRDSVAQILYADCQSIAVKGKTFVVNYRNNKKEKFYHIAAKEKRKIKLLLKTVLLQGQTSVAQTRTHLCPRCTEELAKDEYTCSSCNLMFKDKVEAKKISIVYPGGGYFYTRHPVLGISDALVEITLMASIITSLIDAMRHTENSDFSIVVSLVIILAIEKAVTVHDSNKFINEYIPIEKQISTVH